MFPRSAVPRFGPGQVAAITGAASGIGRAMALQLARDGVALSLADLDQDGLRHVVTSVRQLGGAAEGQMVDVCDAGQVDAWAQGTMERFGAVNIVGNVAGIAGDVTQSSLIDLHRLLDVDFWGVVHGTKAFLPQLIAGGGGILVNVSSAFGLISVGGYGGYNAAKFAVRGWRDANE